MNKKLITSVAGIAISGLAVAACTSGGGNSAQQQENRAQTQDSQSLITDQPIPHFNYSQIRQTLIDAETIAANGTQTTSFFFQMGLGSPVFSCPSIGMPVANTAELTNPNQVQWNTAGSSGVASAVIGQMDPSGIYTPSASTGTYVICVNTSGQKYLQYWEGDVMTVAAGAVWDSATHQIKVTGAPTATIHTAPHN